MVVICLDSDLTFLLRLKEVMNVAILHSLMAGSVSWGGNTDVDSSHFEKLHIEPIYDAFLCPLTKQVMRDPVTLDSGQTFEREAIEKWLRECTQNRRKLVCPVTLRELRSTELSPSIALRHTIEEWQARNEAAKLDMARRSLSLSSSETDILQALKFVQHLCLNNHSNRRVVRDAELIPMIVGVLKSSIRRVRCMALETLRIVVEGDSDNKVVGFAMQSISSSVSVVISDSN